MQNRSQKNKQMKNTVKILFLFANGIKDDAHAVNYSAKGNNSNEFNSILAVFINGVNKHNGNPANNKVKNQLQLFKFFLVNKCQCSAKGAQNKTEGAHNYCKNLVERINAYNSHSDARSRN